MNYKIILFAVCQFFFLYACKEKLNDQGSGLAPDGMNKPTMGVVSAHEIASKVGLEVLKDGGNAFDAAVAVHFALAVVHPQAGNIGGGGFMVYHHSDGTHGSLDFREKAPSLATSNMFLDSKGDVDKEKSRNGIFSVGVPGSVGGMVSIHEKFGDLDWSRLLQPAIDFAKMGHAVTSDRAEAMNKYLGEINQMNGENHDFFRSNRDWKEGDNLIQKELSKTLESISLKGFEGFYDSWVADSIVNESKRRNGLLSHDDLLNYQAVWREPIHAEIGDYEIISMGPPSSGGIAIVQLLKGSEWLLKDSNHNDFTSIQLMTEIMKYVYADRASHLGDPDFIDIAEEKLISDDYLKTRLSKISEGIYLPSNDIKSGAVDIIESFETTHFSIYDKWGNAVSITTTLNSNFGSKVIVKGAGFFLNNEMDDFSAKPGVPNQFGLVGDEANKIEPNKRMLSSMSPTIVKKDGKVLLILGSPGGSTIITNVYQTIQNCLRYEMDIQQAINAPKIHHQWLPEIIHVEKNRLDISLLDSLMNNNFEIKEVKSIGHLNAIQIDEKCGVHIGADTLRGESKGLSH